MPVCSKDCFREELVLADTQLDGPWPFEREQTSSMDECSRICGVTCMGAAGVDQISVVRRYPLRDEKIRALSTTVQGGGNAANTATAIARLCDPHDEMEEGKIEIGLLTKVGGVHDPFASQIARELEEDAVDVSFLHYASGSHTPSPQTFIINDMETSSRTCIHTPMEEELTTQEIDNISPEVLKSQLIHFDSRQSVAAVHLANKAAEAAVPMSLDIEKYRPGAPLLLSLCDILFTNETFPSLFRKENSFDFNVNFPATCDFGGTSSETIVNMLGILHAGRAKVVVTTLGSNGALLLKRKQNEEWDHLKSRIHLSHMTTLSSTIIRPLMFYGVNYHVETWEFTVSTDTCESDKERKSECTYEVLRCPIWPHDVRPIVDSTGAGDSFIGGFLTGLLHGLCDEELLKLASIVSSQKLRGVGARSSLPSSKAISSILQQCSTDT